MRIFVAGHSGMVGSAILRALKNENYEDVVTISRGDLDLTRQQRVERWFTQNNFDVVINCAARVGGIHSNNTYRAEFIYNNLQIQNNLINSSYISGVKKFLLFGTF